MSNSIRDKKIKEMTLAAMLLAITYIIPTLTQSIPSFNIWFSPMHLPVLVAGFAIGWKYGLLIGFLAPILRAYTIGMPAPIAAWPMAFELASYGFITGIMYQYLPKRLPYIYLSLITALIFGRGVNILSKLAFLPLFGQKFVFISVFNSILQTYPAFILNLILVPLILIALHRAKLIRGFKI